MAIHIGVRERDWIAVQVRAGSEKAVKHGLQQRGYEEFLPLSKRIEGREAALFPGYIFCRYIPAPKYRIVDVPGVIRLVVLAGELISIPEPEIEAIRRVVDSGFCALPHKFLQTGQEVVVTSGPLKGIRGILILVCRAN